MEIVPARPESALLMPARRGLNIVTMKKKRLMPAGVFKVAEVAPIRTRGPRALRGSAQTHGDLVAPVLGNWDLAS